jgi:hypothetical protein
VNDLSVQEHIEALVEEEKRLLHEGEGGPPDPDRHKRLEEVKVELDRYWDLLRQRRAREEFGLDPDEASARGPGTVENYEQ